jgi:hypothetical protein
MRLITLFNKFFNEFALWGCNVVKELSQKIREEISCKKEIWFALFSLSLLIGVLVVSTIGFVSRAEADIFYAVSNYSNGSAGVIAKNGGDYSVYKNLVSNFGLDAWGFTFRDHNGAERAMIREYNYGPNDGVYVYDPTDWKNPVFNGSDWGSNIHAVASNGRYLYLATYESYKGSSSGQDTGEVVRIDMSGGYAADKRYQYQAFTGDAGFESSPHGEAIEILGGKIYVLFGVSYNGVSQYEPSEIVEFDAELNKLRSVKLRNSSGKTGKNAVRMAVYGGKLYVACMGGYQGPDSWGDLWEVDPESMTASQVLDGLDIPHELPDGTTAAVGIYGVQFASDGTAFILAGSYSASNKFRARLFITTASALSNGQAGEAVLTFSTKGGFSWEILWDEKESTLWCMGGTELQAIDKNGAVIRTFTPSELGDNIYSFSLLDNYTGGGSDNGGGGNSGSNGGGGGGCDSGAAWLFAALVLGCVKVAGVRLRLWKN